MITVNEYRLKVLALLKREKLQYFLMVIFSIFISFLYFGRNLKAKMGIIDDHTYIQSGVLQNHSLIWNNFIKAPEIRSFGNIERFRIIWNLINNIETAFFGLNAPYFYLVELFALSISIFTIFYLVKKNLGIIWAIPFTLFVVGQKYFAFIYTRLGTSEVWTMLGLSIYALAFDSIYHKSEEDNKYSDWKECLAMFLGVVLMIGTKENFAVIGVLVLTLLVILYLRKRLTKTVIFASIVMLFINIYQFLDIFLSVNKAGVDFYQNNAKPLQRLEIILKGAFSSDALYLSLFFVLVAVSVAIFYCNQRLKGKIKKKDPYIVNYFVRPMAILLILATFYLFNLYIYNGILYTNYRYSFPSIFIGQLLLLLYLRWGYGLWHKNIKKIDPNVFRVYYVAVLIVLSFSVLTSMQYARQMSSLNVEATTLFQTRLKEIVADIGHNSSSPIVFQTYLPSDYEPLISVAAYLRYDGVENKIMIKTDPRAARRRREEAPRPPAPP